MVEDSLKVIFNLEYENLEADETALRDKLQTTLKSTRRLTDKLQSMKLIDQERGKLLLTKEGRAYALRIIRIHRLLEKYLADETSIPESNWHRHAESKEHHLSESEIELLAVSLGNPGFDPHGDPIPDRDGKLPSHQGIPLIQIPEGRYARILHIEDEPASTYSQIVALGLHPGTQLMMMERSAERLRFEANGEECVLSPLIAESITVKIIDNDDLFPENHKILTDLQPGEEGEIIALSTACHGIQRRRLMDLGILPGSVIRPELVSFSGDPTAYRVRGTLIALRKDQTRQILVKPTGKDHHAEPLAV